VVAERGCTHARHTHSHQHCTHVEGIGRGPCCPSRYPLCTTVHTHLPNQIELGCPQSPAPWQSPPVVHSQHPGGSQRRMHPCRPHPQPQALHSCGESRRKTLLRQLLHSGGSLGGVGGPHQASRVRPGLCISRGRAAGRSSRWVFILRMREEGIKRWGWRGTST
jgi:hypothetical protein